MTIGFLTFRVVDWECGMLRCIMYEVEELYRDRFRCVCYDMEVGENRVSVFYGTEKREGERLEIYTGGISPCSCERVSDP
jgi:hypothetical protein